ncbi:gluconeogenesis factor YvcK family protein [Alkalibacillus almallahensis]|uniref:gluconeogenesis factor YvcK family protein n=1 Tax=Alkalibacillus almallahensis TaxID=1379154 RepID=UPI001420CCE3|nr:YvcK family protein [Alkalibacillus almallahensis]NIK12540.1 putative cofD-like protein [Alkalibacillus almallahensis]
MTDVNGPKVVVIGGGTGLPVLLRGLRKFPVNLSAIVTVSDDGGSTGRLREDLSMPAPGDIRKVIASMSDVEPTLLKLFQHRFEDGNGLSGHALGNLILAGMTSITGDFYQGIKEISRVFNVKGRIYPIANENMYLKAEFEDGTVVRGESKIPEVNKPIKRVFFDPPHIQPLPEAVRAIKQAELIVIAPGSLYTSIVPNLISWEIKDALRQTNAETVYVCNVMTQEGETADYTASDHIEALHRHVENPFVDSIVMHGEQIEQTIKYEYEKEHAEPVICDRDELERMGVRVIQGDIADLHSDGTLKHHEHKIANLLYELL